MSSLPSALDLVKANVKDIDIMKSVNELHFKEQRTLNLSEINLLMRVWCSYNKASCRASRAAQILNLPEENVEKALEMMDVMLSTLDSLPRSGEKIDLNVIAAYRKLQVKNPLVDIILHTSRLYCVQCNEKLEWHPNKKHRSGKRIVKQDMSSNETTRSAIVLDITAHAKEIGTKQLTCKLIKKYCDSCGLEHRIDRAVRRDWLNNEDDCSSIAAPSGAAVVSNSQGSSSLTLNNRASQGPPKIIEVVLYPHADSSEWCEVTSEVFITRDTLRAIDASIIHQKLPFSAIEKGLEHVVSGYDLGKTALPTGAGRFPYRMLEDAFFVNGVIQSLAYIYGSGNLNNVKDLVRAFASDAAFKTYLIEASEPKNGLLAVAVRMSGMGHDVVFRSSDTGTRPPCCDHGCHMVGLVNDGNYDIDRPRCRLCPHTPMKSCDYCSTHCGKYAPLVEHDEYYGHKCLVRIKVKRKRQEGQEKETVQHTRVLGTVGSKIYGQDQDGTSFSHWSVSLTAVTIEDQQQQQVAQSDLNLTRYELRDALTAFLNNDDDAATTETKAEALRRVLAAEEEKSGGMVTSCLPKGLESTRPRTHGWQAYIDLEGYVWHVEENAMHSEGARSILSTYVTLIRHAVSSKLTGQWPLRDPQDSACFQIQTRFVALIELLKGEPGLAFAPQDVWILVVLLAVDIYVDRFHFPNHGEGDFCHHLMNPEDRVPYLKTLFPGYNDQVCEQLWSIAVSYAKSMTYMSIGSHRGFMCLVSFKLNQLRRDRATTSTYGALNRSPGFEASATKTPQARAKERRVQEVHDRLVKLAAASPPPKPESESTEISSTDPSTSTLKTPTKVSWSTGTKRWSIPTHCSRPFPDGYKSIRSIPLALFQNNVHIHLRFFRCFVESPWDQLDAEIRFIARMKLQDWLVDCSLNDWKPPITTRVFSDHIEDGEVLRVFEMSAANQDFFTRKYMNICLHIKRSSGSSKINEHLTIVGVIWRQSEDDFASSILDLTSKKRKRDDTWRPEYVLICELMHMGHGDSRVPESVPEHRYLSFAKEGFALVFTSCRRSPYNGNIAFTSDSERFQNFSSSL